MNSDDGSSAGVRPNPSPHKERSFLTFEGRTGEKSKINRFHRRLSMGVDGGTIRRTLIVDVYKRQISECQGNKIQRGRRKRTSWRTKEQHPVYTLHKIDGNLIALLKVNQQLFQSIRALQ